MSLYISITEKLYINSIYFAAITCETTLAGLINSDQKHTDVGPTRTVLFGMLFIFKNIEFVPISITLSIYVVNTVEELQLDFIALFVCLIYLFLMLIILKNLVFFEWS